MQWRSGGARGRAAGCAGRVRRCTALLTCLGRPCVLGLTLGLSQLDPIPPCLSDVSWVEHFLLGQRVSLSLRYGSDTLEGGKTRTGLFLGVQQIRKTGAPKHRQRFLSVRSKHSKYTRGKHSSSQSHQHALNSLSLRLLTVGGCFGVRERQSNFSALEVRSA